MPENIIPHLLTVSYYRDPRGRGSQGLADCRQNGRKMRQLRRCDGERRHLFYVQGLFQGRQEAGCQEQGR